MANDREMRITVIIREYPNKQGYFFSLHLRTFLDTEPFGTDYCACCRLSEIWYFEQYELFIIVGGIVVVDWPGSTELIIICGRGTSLTVVSHLSFQQLFCSKNTRVCLHVHILIGLLFSAFLTAYLQLLQLLPKVWKTIPGISVRWKIKRFSLFQNLTFGTELLEMERHDVNLFLS